MWLRELLPVALERLAEGFEGLEGGQTAGSNALKNRWLGHVAVRVVASSWKGLRKGLRGLRGLRAGKRQARTPLKTDGCCMWLRELLPVAMERLAEGFEGLEGGQTAGSNALKNRWLGHVAVRVVASSWKGLRKGLRGLRGLRAGKRQARTPLKTDGWGMWLRELLPVALETPAEGFDGFEGGQTAGSNALKNRGHVAARVVAVALEKPAEGFEGLEGGKRQARMPSKADGWGMWLPELSPVPGKACGRVWGVWGVWGRANGRLERP